MVSLQQTNLSSFASADCVAVAFLLRSCTVLTFNATDHLVNVHRQAEKGTWKCCGRWALPKIDRIIGFYALESFYYFLILSERNNHVEATFLDLNANHLNTVVLPNSSGTKCADFDQKRKELLLISKRSEIRNFAVRLVVATLKGGESDSSFHVIHRLHTKIPDPLRSVPHQIICQDISGCTLVLLESGCVVSFETSTLEILWHIDPERFVKKPQKLYADKFSPSFVIYCCPLNDPTDGIGHLEFWTPPTDFQQINSSLFERYVIPLQTKLVHFHIESIGDDYFTSMIIIQENRNAQLWGFHPEIKQLEYQSQLIFTGSESSFTYFQSNDPSTQTSLATSKNYSDIGSFIPAAGLPGCKVIYIGFSKNGYCTIALHSPCTADKNWMLVDQQQTFLDIFSLEQIQDSQLGDIEEFLSPNREDSSPVQQKINSPLHLPQPRMSLPSVATMNDSISLDEERRSRPSIIQSQKIIKKQKLPQQPHVLFFLPASHLSKLFGSASEYHKDNLFQVISPSGLALISDNSFHKPPQTNLISQNMNHPPMELRRFCREGLHSATSAPIPRLSSLNFNIIHVACRSSMAVLITDLKEGFVFNLNPLLDSRAESHRPIRLELEIRPQAHVSSLMVSDILIRMDPTQVQDQRQFQSLEGSGVIGTHILTMVGDTDGFINFSICSLMAVLHQGSIRAHTTPIVSILCTGDASRNLWKIGTRIRGTSRQVEPRSCPGSSIVSVSQDGEVKIWQPIFSQQNNARSNPFQILSIFQLSWKISGLLMVLNRNTESESRGIRGGGEEEEENAHATATANVNAAVTVTSSFLDPSCLSCVIATSDGELTQWPLPGLVNRSDGKVQIGKSFIWNCRRHQASITHTSMCINLPKTSVNIIAYDNNTKKTNKLCHLVYDNTSVDPKEECHIGYTVDDLRKYVENTLLVVSSIDKTISLWRFIITKNTDTPEFMDPMVKRTLPHFKYLSPVYCRVFTLSSTPELSFCYPLLSQLKPTLWRISTLVNGIVINVAEETISSLGKSLEPRDLNSSSFSSSSSSSSSSENIQIGYVVDSISVLCSIHKSQYVSEYSSKYGVHTQFSWEIYNEWQNEYLLLPDLVNCDLDLDQTDLHNLPYKSITPPLPIESTEPPLKSKSNMNLVEFEDAVGSKDHPKGRKSTTDKPPSTTAQSSSEKKVSVFCNGVYMKVPQNEAKEIEKETKHNSKTKATKKRFVVTKDKTRPPTAKPTEEIYPTQEDPLVDQDNNTESSGIVLSVQTPIPRRAPSLSELDAAAFPEFDFKVSPDHVPENPTDIAFAMSDDISSETSSINFQLDISEDTMKIGNENLGQHLKPKGSKLVRSLGIATKAFNGKLGPSLRQPYRSAGMSVPLPTKLKETYEPQPQQKFIANPAKVDPLLEKKTPVEGVSVYRTPASANTTEDMELMQFFDGGLERIPNQDVLNSNNSKLLSFLQNPSSHFDRLNSPLYYRMTSLEKLLQRKQSSQQCDFDSMTEENSEGDEDDDDDDLSFTSELSGGLSTVSQIEAVKSLMADSEKSIFENMSEEEKNEFLLKKKEENIRIIRESRRAFHSLLSNPVSVQSYADTEELTSILEHTARTSVTNSEGNQNTVSFEKVLNWDKIEEATNAGISQDQITEILQKTVSKRRKNLADMRFNLTQFTRFAKELNKAVLETQYPPEINVLVTDTRSTTCDVSIESTKFGTAHVIIFKEGRDIPKASDFNNLKTLAYRYKGVAQIITKSIHEKTTVEFTIKGLKPKTSYRLFCCAQHENNEKKRVVRATDDMIAATLTRFRTEEPPPEVLDLEWNRLKPIDQFDELTAVVFDLPTQEKALASGLRIPTIDSLEKWLDAVEEGELSGNESEGSDDDDSTVKLKDVKEFVNWWIGDEYGFSEHRSDFLKREAIFVCGDGETIEKCEDEGFLTLAQSATLSSLVNDEDETEIIRSEEFIRFRSWMKGGRVIQDIIDEKLEMKREKLLEGKRVKLLAKERQRDEKKVKKVVVMENKDNSDNEDDEDGGNSVEEKPAEVKVTEEVEEVEEENNNDDDENDDDNTSDVSNEEENGAILARISDRSQKLQERSGHVEDAIKAIANLHMAYRHGHADGLSVRDLELKRGQLRMESITVIMAMKKLEELCEAKNIAVKDLEESMYQLISGASTFVEISEETLKAEMPPHATLLTLLGQDKRPLKGWDKCSSYEKELEIQLAGMITTIVELAVEAGVSVPNIEDPYVMTGPNAQIGRKTRWDNFEKWYIGNELHENQLRAMPTVARIMFTDWEKKHVKDDTKLREVILQRHAENPPPSHPQNQSNKKKAGGAGGAGAVVATTAASKPIKRMATGDLGLTVAKSAVDEDEVVKLYEIEVNKAGGETFRAEVLKKQVMTVLKSRNLSMMRLFWPPSGSSRPTSQYLFPRLGLIYPKYEEPVKRFKAFPSKSSEMYSIEEVMAWFRPAELIEDDEINMRNELEGQKHQAYLNWLAEEEERMERGRLQMVDEDILSLKLRLHTRGIEVDRELPQGKPRYRDFVFGRRLPGQYEDLGTKTVKYLDGSGVDNEDEVQDILEKMAKETELSLQHAKELKKKQIEDRKRKEEEDRIKQEKLERDQRIEENKDRLKKIREHLENIKLQRKIQEEEKQKEMIENEMRKQRELLQQEEYLKQQEQMKRESQQIEKERRLMNCEDVYHAYCREKAYNHKGMFEEDEMGFVRREVETKKRLNYERRLKELEEIYEEYVPFQFQSNKIRNKRFHDTNFDENMSNDQLEEEEEEAIKSLIRGREGGLSQQINWKLFLKERNDHLHELMTMNPSASSSAAFSSTNHLLDRLSPIQLIQNSNSNITEQKNKKIWPRTENIEIAPPLIWSGPSLDVEKKYSKLRKKSRPYTPLNPSEEMYANAIDNMDPMEILLPQNEIVNHLEHIGMSKSMIKSMKSSKSLPVFELPQERPTSTSTATGGTQFPKLKNHQLALSPKRFQQPSFQDPLRYQSSTDDLLIMSPSKELPNLHLETSDSLRNHPPAPVPVPLPSSSCSPRSPSPLLPHPLPLPDNTSLPQNILQHHQIALKSLLEKRKQRKNSDQLIEKIKSDREALRAFITSASSATTDDRFYLEACRPGLRSHDSINSNQLIQNYRQTLLQSFENKSLYQGSALITAVKESINVSMSDSMTPTQLHSKQTHPTSVGSTGHGNIIIDKERSMSASSAPSPSHSQSQSQGVKGGFGSLPSSPSHSNTIDHSLPLSDETSVNSKQQELNLQPTNNQTTIKGSLPLSNVGNLELMKQPPFEPPFSRKVFGIRGEKKVIAELNPALLANELISDHEVKSKRGEARLGQGQGQDGQGQGQGQGKGSINLETQKSKQRNEYSSILRKTIETSRKNYNVADVNFINNKGL